MDFRIEKMKAENWEAVRAIYIEGIATGNATFETDAPKWEEWDKAHLRVCRIVARAKDQIVGWTALSPVSSRCVYAGVAEVSVYVAESARGQGVGKALLQALVEESECEGIWTLQAGIFPENAASVALHRRMGFRQVGIRERIGQMNGVWRDVLLMERRSNFVGAVHCIQDDFKQNPNRYRASGLEDEIKKTQKHLRTIFGLTQVPAAKKSYGESSTSVDASGNVPTIKTPNTPGTMP